MLKKLKPHNQKVYNSLINELKISYKAVIVQATGTGKGVIANNLVFDRFKGKSILFVVPSNSIKDGHIANLEFSKSDNIVFVTYQKLTLSLKTVQDIEKYCNNFEVVIFDEMHRGGACEWSKVVKYIIVTMEKNKKYSIGLTATPQRFSDNKNIITLFFDGKYIKGVNLVEAIQLGILPKFKYVVSLYNYESEILRINERVNNISEEKKKGLNYKSLKEPLSKLKLLQCENEIIRKTVKEETKDLPKNQKWIVFCDDINSINDLKEKIKFWFNKEITFFEVHSNQNSLENKRNLDTFNSLKLGCNVLLSINMLNEGVHIKNITGIIMLRKTLSPIVYLQQIGRVLATDTTIYPIIFDFIGNYRNLITSSEKKIDNYNYLKMMKDIAYAVNTYNFEINCNGDSGISVSNELEGCSVVNSSDIFYRENEQYNTNKNNDVVETKEDKKALNNCVIVENYVENTCELLKNLDLIISKINNNIYSEEEDLIICMYYPDEGKKILKRLPDRTEKSIYTRAYELGVYSKRFWSDIEIEILKKYYEKHKEKLLELGLLGYRGKDAIESKARELGLQTERYKNYYDFSQIDLKEFEKRFKADRKECFKYYGMTETQGRGFVNRNNIQGIDNDWDLKEDEKLRYLYENTELGYAVCKYFSNRTEGAVISRISKLKLKSGKRKNFSWTNDDIKKLEKYWGRVTKEEIEQLFYPRTYNTIKQKALRLGLKK